MRNNAVIAALLLLFCDGVCAAWVKDGATEAQISSDQAECDRKARADVAFRRPQSMRGPNAVGGTSTTNTMAAELKAANLCMKSKGYVESPRK